MMTSCAVGQKESFQGYVTDNGEHPGPLDGVPTTIVCECEVRRREKHVIAFQCVPVWYLTAVLPSLIYIPLGMPLKLKQGCVFNGDLTFPLRRHHWTLFFHER